MSLTIRYRAEDGLQGLYMAFMASLCITLLLLTVTTAETLCVGTCTAHLVILKH